MEVSTAFVAVLPAKYILQFTHKFVNMCKINFDIHNVLSAEREILFPLFLCLNLSMTTYNSVAVNTGEVF